MADIDRPTVHETHSIDIICLLQGEASLILESGETRSLAMQRGHPARDQPRLERIDVFEHTDSIGLSR